MHHSFPAELNRSSHVADIGNLLSTQLATELLQGRRFLRMGHLVPCSRHLVDQADTVMMTVLCIARQILYSTFDFTIGDGMARA
jgi:hypothetical protein